MANNDDLLQKIGNLIDQKLEAEREHTRKLVREEVEVEATETRSEFRMKLLRVDAGLINVKDKLKDVAITNTQTNTALAQITTVVEAVKAGQDDIRKELASKADKADIQDLDAKLDKYQKKNEQRFENVEEHTGATNPHKN